MGSLKQAGALNSTLGAITAHPLRTRCLTILFERTASPNELAKELGEEIGNVSYHVKQLVKMEAIELVSERPVRGAVEHFYRALKRPMLSVEDYDKMTVEERLRFARLVIQFSVADAATAIETASLGHRPDHHVSRVPLTVDEEGWKELVDIYAETLQRTIEAEAASVKRMSENPDSAAVSARAISWLFEMPGPGERV
jgi:DNA-binding transcriptional ArsR family regulator